MPIVLTEIASFPVYDESGQHDEDHATLVYRYANGDTKAQFRVLLSELLSDLPTPQTKEELLALIEQEGAQPVALTLQV
jgi:hypothetical protein